MELGLSSIAVQYLSPVWMDVLGQVFVVMSTRALFTDKVLRNAPRLGESISGFMSDEDGSVFAVATNELLDDDSRTVEVRFHARTSGNMCYD